MLTQRSMLVGYFDNEADFYSNVEGQGRDTDRRAAVPAYFSEYFEQKVGGSIEDFGVVVEFGTGIDESVKGDNASDFF